MEDPNEVVRPPDQSYFDALIPGPGEPTLDELVARYLEADLNPSDAYDLAMHDISDRERRRKEKESDILVKRHIEINKQKAQQEAEEAAMVKEKIKNYHNEDINMYQNLYHRNVYRFTPKIRALIQDAIRLFEQDSRAKLEISDEEYTELEDEFNEIVKLNIFNESTRDKLLDLFTTPVGYDDGYDDYLDDSDDSDDSDKKGSKRKGGRRRSRRRRVTYKKRRSHKKSCKRSRRK